MFDALAVTEDGGPGGCGRRRLEGEEARSLRIIGNAGEDVDVDVEGEAPMLICGTETLIIGPPLVVSVSSSNPPGILMVGIEGGGGLFFGVGAGVEMEITGTPAPFPGSSSSNPTPPGNEICGRTNVFLS